MLAYEIWTTIIVLGAVFAALYPEDTSNLLRLVALAPSMVRLWLIQRWFMLKLGPRLMLDNLLMRRRMSRLARRHNTDETTPEETNT